ncbi:MAG TPA: MGMT family protein, partial [Candidatus Competibacteraceae bacterium]|nr:MGMT family protein [Candidatus Competibacteraceae bacterium]
LGLPRRARLVGRALRETPVDLKLPWHRVLNAQGRIAFPVGSEPFREQEARLRAEGVPVLGGRVDLPRYRWRPDLDELLWGELLESGESPPRGDRGGAGRNDQG